MQYLKLLRRPLARSFSSEVATVSEADAIKSKRWTQTVTPWNARPDLVPAEENAVTAKNTKGFVGQLAGTPPDFLKRRARIYRRARQTTSSSSEKTKAWKIEFNHQRKINYIIYHFIFFIGSFFFVVVCGFLCFLASCTDSTTRSCNQTYLATVARSMEQ